MKTILEFAHDQPLVPSCVVLEMLALFLKKTPAELLKLAGGDRMYDVQFYQELIEPNRCESEDPLLSCPGILRA